MDKRFKWNMLITSFIPLWLSIIVADVWSVTEQGINNWLYEKNFIQNLEYLIMGNWVCLVVLFANVNKHMCN